VRYISNQILITVHYLVEAEKDDFWDKDTGYLNKQVSESFKKRFPQKAKLAEKMYAQRYSLTYQRIDYLNANLIKCPICERLVTDMTKSRPIYRLDAAEELNGVMMCSSCAWEQGFDIKKHKIIPGKPPLPEGARLIHPPVNPYINGSDSDVTNEH